MFELTWPEPNCTCRKVKKMKGDEDNQEHPTPAHHACCESRLDIALDAISNWSRSLAHTTELNCRGDMKGHTDEQDDSYHPEQLSIGKFGCTYFPQES